MATEFKVSHGKLGLFLHDSIVCIIALPLPCIVLALGHAGLSLHVQSCSTGAMCMYVSDCPIQQSVTLLHLHVCAQAWALTGVSECLTFSHAVIKYTVSMYSYYGNIK